MACEYDKCYCNCKRLNYNQKCVHVPKGAPDSSQCPKCEKYFCKTLPPAPTHSRSNSCCGVCLSNLAYNRALKSKRSSRPMNKSINVDTELAASAVADKLNGITLEVLVLTFNFLQSDSRSISLTCAVLLILMCSCHYICACGCWIFFCFIDSRTRLAMRRSCRLR